ncbi:MAG: PadR family transcriptional regulator [Oscillospiraceae bacterium]|nr:PadR family transcriptional regulator [Oscillospiraceae bacterium]
MEQEVTRSKRGRKKKISVSPEGMEENLKKGVAEMLVLFLLKEREMYVNELTEELENRSDGRLHITFPYAIIYRLLDTHYIELGEKRLAPDGRRRQYYRTTTTGGAYLEELQATMRKFMGGVEQILRSGEK